MANEKRLIDAYSLAEQVWESKDKNPHRDIKIARNHRLEHEHFLKMICLAHTVDAVEVVRCKDCRDCEMCYPEKQLDKEATRGWICKKYKRWTKPDDFCYYGVKKGDVDG